MMIMRYLSSPRIRVSIATVSASLHCLLYPLLISPASLRVNAFFSSGRVAITTTAPVTASSFGTRRSSITYGIVGVFNLPDVFQRRQSMRTVTIDDDDDTDNDDPWEGNRMTTDESDTLDDNTTDKKDDWWTEDLLPNASRKISDEEWDQRRMGRAGFDDEKFSYLQSEFAARKGDADVGIDIYTTLKPEGWEIMTVEEHLKYQREVFDEKSVFFGSEDAVDEELVPVLTHLGKRVVEQMVQSRLDGEGKVDDGEDEGLAIERKKYTILDVGCGTGALFPYYLKAADNAGIDLSITGLDLSPKMISLAKKCGETLLTSLGEGGGSKHNFKFVEGDFVRTVLGEEYETKNEGEGEENGSGDKKRTDNLIGCGDGVEDELTEEYRGAYDAVVINACFGNFYDQVATTTAACQSLKLNGIFAISHPLGADFVRKLNVEDSSMVPHHLPTALDFRRLTRTQPLSAHSVLDEEINLLDATRQVQSYPFYYASTSRVPHRPLRDVVRFRAPVARGYGRGGKKLGFPTANLQSSPVIRAALDEVPTGVYFGWAVLEDFSKDVQKTGRNTWHRAVVNVGLSPTFEGKENGEKIVEAHLILNSEKDIEGDFYDETMRLALSGFLRPEKKFPSFPDLINAINGDVANAREALGTQLFVVLKTDIFLADLCLGSLVDSSAVWVGASGGDENASYEFQNLEEAIADTPMGPLAV